MPPALAVLALLLLYCLGPSFVTSQTSSKFAECVSKSEVEPPLLRNETCILLEPGWGIVWPNFVTAGNPCVDRWKGVTCDYADGPITGISLSGHSLGSQLPSIFGDLNSLTTLVLTNNTLGGGTIPVEFGKLTALVTLDLSRNSLNGTLPSQLSSLTRLETLNLAHNSLTGTIADVLGSSLKKSELTINLDYNPGLSGPIPCGFRRGLGYLQYTYFQSYPLYNSILTWSGDALCYPPCFLGSDYYLSENEHFANYAKFCNCDFGQYYDSPNYRNVTGMCTSCGFGYTTGSKYSVSADDCTSVIANVAMSVIALLTSFALAVIYVFWGRYHYVAFVRFERLVLKLIAKYKLTISALLRLQKELRAGFDKAATDTQPRSTKLRRLVLFWSLSFLMLFFVPLFMFVGIISKRFLDALILFNSMKAVIETEISNYSRVISGAIDAIGKAIGHEFFAALFKALFEPFRVILVALSQIHIDLGAVKVTCTGAQAPFYLLIQIVVLGIVVIIIDSDLQVFKMTVFKQLLDKFKSIAASDAYRNYAVGESGGFHWSVYRYTRFLAYTAVAEGVSYVADFPSILRFLMSLVKYDGVMVSATSSYSSSAEASLNQLRILVLYVFVYPWIGPFIFINSRAIVNACDSLPEIPMVDSAIFNISFVVSVFLIIPVFYEVGKVVAPGNRSRRDISLGSASGRNSEDYKLMWYTKPGTFLPPAIASRVRCVYEACLWSLSFVSLDIWLVWLAERWLRLIHTAVPPSQLKSTSSTKSNLPSKTAERRGTLGWGHIMQHIDDESLKTPHSTHSEAAVDAEATSFCAQVTSSCHHLATDSIFASVYARPPAEKYALYPPKSQAAGDAQAPKEAAVEADVGAAPSEKFSQEDRKFRFDLHPAKDEQEELDRWVQHCQHGALPTYYEFLTLQYLRVLRILLHYLSVSLNCCCSKTGYDYHPYIGGLFTRNEAFRLFMKLVAATCVWYGLGNLTRGSRTIWWQIFKNYVLFFVSAAGIWTAKAREVFAVDQCIRATTVEEEQEEATPEGGGESATDVDSLKAKDVTVQWMEYTQAWASIVTPRSILLMIIPQLTPVTLYTMNCAPSPLWIADASVPLPGLLDFASYYQKAESESTSQRQKWTVLLDAIYLFATESRLVQTVVNFYNFAFVMALDWIGEDQKKLLALMVSSLVVLLPYCYARSLKLIVYLGQTLSITDEDLSFCSQPPPSPSSSPSPSPSHKDEGVDGIPHALPLPQPPPQGRPSVTSFDAIYQHSAPFAESERGSESDRTSLARGGSVGLGLGLGLEMTSVENPLATRESLRVAP